MSGISISKYVYVTLFDNKIDIFELQNSEHIAEIKRLHHKRRLTQHQLDRLHFDTFNEWFKEQVSSMIKSIVSLSYCPCTCIDI